jgi:hypothetical protein
MAMNLIALHTEPRRAGGRLDGLCSLVAAPIAWVAQIYAGYALASEACYPGSERRLKLPAHLVWTRAAIALVMIAACLVSLLALASSLRSYRRSRNEVGLDLGEVIRTAAQRTSFLSLWGIIFSAGAAGGSLLTHMAYFLLPQCAG